jgi:hypothetical protein
MYAPRIFAHLDRVCEDCYNLYRDPGANVTNLFMPLVVLGGAATFSIMTVSITIKDLNTQHRTLSTMTLNTVMLSVTNKPTMLRVVMLSVVLASFLAYSNVCDYVRSLTKWCTLL